MAYAIPPCPKESVGKSSKGPQESHEGMLGRIIYLHHG